MSSVMHMMMKKISKNMMPMSMAVIRNIRTAMTRGGMNMTAIMAMTIMIMMIMAMTIMVMTTNMTNMTMNMTTTDPDAEEGADRIR